jgi:hypothetical protein
MGFEPTILVLERVKTIVVLDRAAAGISCLYFANVIHISGS